MSYTALVNVDADAANKLVVFISDLIEQDGPGFSEKCEVLLQAGQISDLLCSLLSKTDLILALDEEKDMVCCFQAIIAILYSHVTDIAKEQTVVQSLVDNLSQHKNAPLVLRVFVSVFNLLRPVASKFQVLTATLKYAVENNSANLVVNFQTHIPTWIDTWALPVEQQRELLLLMSEALFAEAQDSEALSLLAQYLTTFSEERVYPQEVVSVAVKAVTKAIKAPIAFYKDRNALFKTMAGHTTTDATLLKLIELLRIVCGGTVEGYLSFYGSNKDLFTQYDLSHETSLKSMRLLGLCLLAARNSTTQHVLTYADIAACLEVSEDEEVEEWVVEAISHGLMDASMDQLNKSIVISRCVQVSFEKEQWMHLQQKLKVWRGNLTSVLEVMRSRQQQQQSSQ